MNLKIEELLKVTIRFFFLYFLSFVQLQMDNISLEYFEILNFYYDIKCHKSSTLNKMNVN